MGCDLSGAVLSDAIFRGPSTQLVTLDLENALCDGTDFNGANFGEINFAGAVFRQEGRVYEESESSRTDLRGVNLASVRGLTTEQLAETRTDNRTRLPDYLASQSDIAPQE
jgi:uncharacterized protein YjbI with pentapeptide repeats